MTIYFLFFLVAINILVSKIKHGTWINLLSIFLALFFLSLSDVYFIDLYGEIYVNNKLNDVSFENFKLSYFLAKISTITFLCFIFLFQLLINNCNIDRFDFKNSNFNEAPEKNIASIFFKLIIIFTQIVSLVIAVKTLYLIKSVGILSYMMEERAGNWILVSVCIFNYILNALHLLKSKHGYAGYITSIVFLMVVYPTGGIFLKVILVSLYIYERNFKVISTSFCLICGLSLVILYPLSKGLRGNQTPLEVIFEIIANPNFVLKVLYSRAHGFSMYTSIIDYVNSNTLNPEVFSRFLARTYEVFLPRSLFPDKVNILGTDLTDIFTHNQYVEGTSLAPSFLGWFYLNIGVFSVALIPILSFSYVWFSRFTSLKKNSNAWDFGLLLIWGGVLVDGNLDGMLFTWYILFSALFISNIFFNLKLARTRQKK